MENTERVNPIRIKDNETDDVYVLDFDRESVKFAEMRGFKYTEVGDFPQTNVPALFYYAFRKNHKNVSRDKADKIRDELGGLTGDEISRLIALFLQPLNDLIVTDAEERSKNSRMTVEM